MLKGNGMAVSLFMTYFNILEEMSAIWRSVTLLDRKTASIF